MLPLDPSRSFATRYVVVFAALIGIVQYQLLPALVRFPHYVIIALAALASLWLIQFHRKVMPSAQAMVMTMTITALLLALCFVLMLNQGAEEGFKTLFRLEHLVPHALPYLNEWSGGDMQRNPFGFSVLLSWGILFLVPVALGLLLNFGRALGVTILSAMFWGVVLFVAFTFF